MKHPRNIEGFNGSIDECVRSVGNMTYDKVAEFIQKLADDLKRQGEEDEKERGYKQVPDGLYETTVHLYKASDRLQGVWKICEKHMENDD